MPTPRVPDKFEDWTPPWADGEFDSDKAARQVYNALFAEQKAKATITTLRAEKGEVEEELSETKAKLDAKPAVDETAKDQSITELTAKVRKLEKDGRPEDKAKIERLTVAMDHGLTAKDAARLVGDTPEELAEDAADLAERLGIKTGDQGDQGDQGNQPPSQRPAPQQLGNGRQREGEAPALVSAADIVRQDAKDRGLTLASLG